MSSLVVLVSEGTASAAPLVSVTSSGPLRGLLGENVGVDLTFDNTSAVDTGYGPYLDVMLPAGPDGNDGLRLSGATYLGAAVSPATSVVCTGAAVTHPFTGVSTPCPVGRQFLVLALPFGSFTPGQPPAPVHLDLVSSNLADPGTAQTITFNGGFRYGDTPTGTTPIVGAPNSTTYTPELLRLVKRYVQPELERATGPNFPMTFVIDAFVASGQTVTNLAIEDRLPDNQAFLSASPASACASPVNATPAAGVPSSPPANVVRRCFPSVVGAGPSVPAASLTVNTFFDHDRSTGSSVLDASTGDDVTSLNDGRANFNWAPIDTVNDGGTVALSVNGLPTDDVTVTAKSLAIQKSVANLSVGGPGNRPGDVLEYTLQAQVSDFFTFGSLGITDVMSDGQSYDDSFVPQLQVTERGNTVTVPITPVVTPSSSAAPRACGAGAGTTTLAFDVSAALAATAVGGVLEGGRVNAPNAGATTIRVVLRSRIDNAYSCNPSVGDPVDLGDHIENDVTITGEVLDNVTGLPQAPQRFESDTSSTGLQMAATTLTKDLYARNGNTSDTGPNFSPGDTVTYRLTFPLPSSDIQNFRLDDYLPLPVLMAANLSSYGGAGAPPSGSWKLGPSDTFTALSGRTPTLSMDAVANSIRFGYGTYDDVQNRSSVIDLLFTVTIVGAPMVDGLFLTNQAQATYQNSFGVESTASAIRQIQLSEPLLQITKGAVAVDATSAGTFSPSVPTPAFSTSTRTFASTVINGTGLDRNVVNADAGDLVTFAVVVENTGSGRHGAYDVSITDAVPAGFAVPVIGGLNLRVTNGLGTPLAYTGTLASGLTLDDSTSGALPCRPGSAASCTTVPGANVAVITFDLEVLNTASPLLTLTNTARLTGYAATEGGPNFLSAPLSDPATVNISTVKLSKAVTATDRTETTGKNVAIGEVVDYTVVITVPEGQTSAAGLVDTLPAGLTLIAPRSAAIVSVTPSNASTIRLGTPAGSRTFAQVLSDAQALTGNPSFTFGTITNSDSNSATDETITIVYRAVVGDVAANRNVNATTKDTVVNSARFSWTEGANSYSVTAADTATLMEPRLTLTKTDSVDPAAANNFVPVSTPMTYTVRVCNANGASVNPAYDLTVTDTLPSQLAAPTAISDAGVFASGPRTITWTLPTLAVNACRDLTYTTSVNSDAVPNTAITNSASVAATGLSGAVAGERAYTAATTNTVRAGTLSLTKATGTPVRTIGEVATFTVTASIPASVSLPDATIIDALPAGLVWSGAASVNVSASPVPTGWAPATLTASGQNIGVFLGDLSTTVPVTVTLTYTARVADVPGNTGGTNLTNTAKVYWNAVNGPNPTSASSGGFTVVDGPSASAVVALREPSMTIAKKVSAPTADVGTTVNYSVTVTNSASAGSANAHDITVTDVVPAGLDLTGAVYRLNGAPCSGSCSATVTGPADGSAVTTVVWSFPGPLAPGAQNTLTYAAALRPSSRLFDATAVVNTANLTSYFGVPSATRVGPGWRTYVGGASSASVTPEFPKLTMAKTTISGAETAGARIGSSFGWRLVVRNAGAAPATHVTVADVLPAGWTYDAGSTLISRPATATYTQDPVVTGSATGDALSWAGPDLGTLDPSESMTITFTARPTVAVLSAPGAGKGPANPHINTASALAQDANGSTANGTGTYGSGPDTAAATVEVADLRVAKSHEGTAVAGANLIYVVDITNNGPSTAVAPITVVDTLPAGATFVSTSTAGWTCGAAGQVVTCTHPTDLASGGTRQLKLTTALDSTLTVLGDNTVQVRSTTYDDQIGTGSQADPAGNNVATHPVVLITDADLSIVKSHAGPVVAGRNVTYTMTVSNNGPSVARGSLVVTDTLPAGLTFVAAGSGNATWTCAAAGQVVTCQTAPGFVLPVGTSTAFGVNTALAADVAQGTALTNQASVRSTTTPDSNPANDTDDDTDTVQAIADLSVLKSHTGTFAAGSAGNTYTVNVANAGPSHAAGPITVVDTLPANITVTAGAGLNWTCSGLPASSSFSCTYAPPGGSLAPGAIVPPLTLTASVAAGAGTGPYQNRVQVSSPTTDDQPGNDVDTDDTGINTVADLAIVKAHVGGNFVAGQTHQYTLSVTNNGPATALAGSVPNQLRVTDNLPAGLTFVSATGAGWTCTAAGQFVTCARTAGGNLAAGTSSTITMNVAVDPALLPQTLNNTATVNGPNPDPIVTNNTDPDSVDVVTVADLAIVKTHAGAFTAGSTGRFDLAVSNTGPSAAAGPVTASDRLPVGFAYRGAAGAGWTCGEAAALVTCTLPGPLAAGASAAPITLTVDVAAATLPGTITNTADVAGPTADPVPTNDTSSDPVTIVDDADLTIVKAHTGTFTAGSTGTFTLDVHNNGPSDASGPLTVVDPLPIGMRYVNGTGAGWTCAATGAGAPVRDTVTCTNPSGLAAAGDATTITLSVLVGADTPVGTLTNSAQVDSPTDDTVPQTAPDATVHDGSDTDPVMVDTFADLAIVKTHTDRFQVGSSARYTLSVSNIGPSDAQGPVVVTDTLPTGLTFIGATGGGWTCSATGQDITCTRGTLAVSATTTITLSVAVGDGAYPAVSNTAAVSSPTTDPDPTNNSSTDPTDIAPLSDLSISKTHTGRFVVGREAAYVLTVINNGPNESPAPIVVEDLLPVGLEFVAASGPGASCGATGQLVRCTISTVMAPGDIVDIDLVVRVTPAAPASITNEATVDGPADDPVLSNNRDDDAVPIEREADLVLTKTAVGQPVQGQRIAYELVVRNLGPSPADAAIVVTDEVPSGLTPVGASGDGWACGVSRQSVSCSFGAELSAGASLPPVMVAVTVDAVGGVLVNHAAVSSPTSDPVPADNTAVAPVQPVAAVVPLYPYEPPASSTTVAPGGDPTAPGSAPGAAGGPAPAPGPVDATLLPAQPSPEMTAGLPPTTAVVRSVPANVGGKDVDQSPGRLSLTGSDAVRLATWGLALVMAGVMALLIARRRRAGRDRT